MNWMLVFKLLYFMLPAYLANTSPVLTKRLFKKKGFPINPRLFGAHKTYRGFIIGIIVAWIVVFIQKWFGFNTIVDYSSVNLWLLGFLIAFGALFGDLVESYFKRKIGIPAGEPWYVIDQLDYPLGVMLFTSFIIAYTFIDFTIILIGAFLITVIANHIGYWLGIIKSKW